MIPPRAQAQLQTHRCAHLHRPLHSALKIPSQRVRVVAQEAEHIHANDLAAIRLRRIEHVDNAGGIEGDEKGFQVNNEVLGKCGLVLVLTP